jgi:hypothetical protein
VDNTLKTIRQEIISVAFVAFCAGTQFAFAMAHYLKSPTNLAVSFILCAGFLVGTIFRRPHYLEKA